MTSAPTSDRPTLSDSTLPTEKNDLDDYLSYRITVPHIDVDKIEAIVRKYADEYLIWPHRGDKVVPKEHFHVIIPTQDKKLYDRLSKFFRNAYGQNGNGFHSGKYHDNGVVDAIAYLKHDISGSPRYQGSYWSKFISDTAAKCDQRESVPVIARRERLGDNILTVGNIVKQAFKQRSHYKTDNLQIIVSQMLIDGWMPSRDLMTNGVPKEAYDIWDMRVSNKPVIPTWLQPHDRSEKKKEWGDTPFFSRYND